MGWDVALKTACQLEHDDHQAHLHHDACHFVTRHTSHVTCQAHRHTSHATQHCRRAYNGVYSGRDAAAALRARGEEASVANLTLKHLHCEPDHTANERAHCDGRTMLGLEVLQ